MKSAFSLELLETRLAPASLVTVNAGTKSAVWTDVDGDLVKLSWTGATAPDFSDLAPEGSFPGGTQVDTITFHNANDAVAVTVQAGPSGGDGRVNLGYLNATGLALKSFKAPLASVLEFDVGDGTNAVGKFSIGSCGTLPAAAFILPGGDGESALIGAVRSFNVAGDLDYGSIALGGNSPAPEMHPIGRVTIGGSLHGDVAQTGDAGVLLIDGPAGAVTIGGSIIGGTNGAAGDLRGRLVLESGALSVAIGGDVVGGSIGASGYISVEGTITGAVTVRGSIIGGSASLTGLLSVETVQGLTVGGNVLGGRFYESGAVSAQEVKGVVSVRGSVVGGGDQFCGALLVQDAHRILIGGDLQGGSGNGSGEVLVVEAASIGIGGSIVGAQIINPTTSGFSGFIYAHADVGSITIGHNLVAGSSIHTDNGTAVYALNGGVSVDGTLGQLNIGGSIEGNNETRAIIIAEGTTPMHGGSFNGLRSLTVNGSVSYAVIASGQAFGDFSTNLGTAENPDAGIGTVHIGRDYYHSSILAGTNDLDEIGAGRLASSTANDDTQSVGDSARFAVLGRVAIKGALLDDSSSLGDSGFEAEQIGKIMVGSVTIFKHSTPGQIQFFDPTHYVFAEEIPAT